MAPAPTPEQFDYIVVGAGSSGAALAVRLAERIRGRVLLLEAGAANQGHFWIRVPIGLAKILGSTDYVWKFQTERQPTLAGQSLYWPRGRMLGGSSSVNGMIYVRGEPAEFDRWRDEFGLRGWGYADVLPYFKRMESARIGQAELRGRDGPVGVTWLGNDRDALSDAFIDACREAGIPSTADYNGEQYEGVSYLQLSTRRGRRSSTATAYLDGRKCANLTIQTQSLARRILFEGRRAIGVEYERAGVVQVAHAQAEVIVSAGPVNSPQLLELSGIGDGERLQRLGVQTVAHLPGVGENLVDHLQSRLTFACTRAITLNDVMRSPVRQALMGMRYLATGRGLMATPSATVHALAKTSASAARPTVKIQLHHLSSRDRFEVVDPRKLAAALDPEPGFTIGFFQLRPESRGSVHAVAADPHRPPQIDPRYLNAEADRATMLQALRLARRVSQQPGIAPFLRCETRPGAEIDSDDELLAYIKGSGQTSFHPVGSCRMGLDDAAVVDLQLRVRGVSSLRVVDSSVMPSMVSSNTNAASIMIGEKAADMLLAG